MSEEVKMTLRFPQQLANSLSAYAESEGLSVNRVMVEATKRFLDYQYLNDSLYMPGTMTQTMEEISRWQHEIQTKELVGAITGKSNQLLSTMAINQYVLMWLVVRSVHPPQGMVEQLTGEAVDFLKQNNRMFSMTEADKQYQQFMAMPKNGAQNKEKERQEHEAWF